MNGTQHGASAILGLQRKNGIRAGDGDHGCALSSIDREQKFFRNLNKP